MIAKSSLQGANIMAKSIMQKEKRCYICGSTYDLHEHHIFFGTANRKQSEIHGFKVWLCARHHNMSRDGVHNNYELNLKLRQECQAKYEETHTRAEFMAIIGKNYIWRE